MTSGRGGEQYWLTPESNPMKRLALALASLLLAAMHPSPAADIRLGLIGLDTSHVTAFTDVLNNPQHKDHVPGARVVAAF